MTDLKDARLGAFRRGLNKVLKNLALQVVRDGEGARKQVEVTVTGAKSARSASLHSASCRRAHQCAASALMRSSSNGAGELVIRDLGEAVCGRYHTFFSC